MKISALAGGHMAGIGAHICITVNGEITIFFAVIDLNAQTMDCII